jgi:hypothetical protein
MMPLKKAMDSEQPVDGEQTAPPSSPPKTEADAPAPKKKAAKSGIDYGDIKAGELYMPTYRDMRDPETRVLYKAGVPTPCALSGWLKAQVGAKVINKYVPKTEG